jgi:hypothetical protein
MTSNSIKNKWHPNWLRGYSKSSCKYGVGRKKKFQKAQIQ